jgi:hypothetical protein
MNKFLLTLGILASGAALTFNLHHRVVLAADAAAEARQAWLTQTQLLALAQTERATLAVRVKERREEVSRQRGGASQPDAEPLLALTNHARLTSAQSEQLLAELGFNWRTQPDYVVVSKENLKKVSVPGMKGMKLSDAACKVLAITPEERGALEATTRELSAEYNSWAQANVRREEPSGEVLAKYSLNPDAAYSQSLSNRFAHTVLGTLGQERSELLLSYAYDWMSGLGMYGGDPTTLTLTRYGGTNAPRLSMKLRQSFGTMVADVSPYQPFPEAFRPIFPGGWTDLAQREGFALPKEFPKK